MIARIKIGNDGTKYLIYFCPGCGYKEAIPFYKGVEYEGPIWGFNGNLLSPSLTPSVRHFRPKSEAGPQKTTCHYYLTNGIIEYLGDCLHNLRSTRTPLPHMPNY